MSPLPITGIATACFTLAIHSQRAWPLYPCSRVRACRATAFSPSASAIRASSTQTMSASFQPRRNFTVKGIVTALRTARKISPMRGRSRSRPEPPLRAHHPLGRAAQIQVHQVEAGLLHNPRRLGQRLGIGAEELRADGVLVVVEGQIALALGLPHPRQPIGRGELGHQQPAARLRVGHGGVDTGCPRSRFCDLRSSALLSAVNKLAWRINRRKTVSVTPAMGASTVAGVTTTGPRRTSAGTRASAGIACSLGLSQSFFTVKPLPAI